MPGKFRSALAWISMKVAPTPWSCWVMVYCSPWTMETTAITAATPMMMPSVVRIERIRLARRAARAMRKFSKKTTGASPLLPSGGRGHGSRLRGACRGLVGDDFTVLEQHLAPGVLGDVRLVGDQHHGVAALVELV